MNRRRIGTSLYSGMLFTVLGVIAWVSGQPSIFPSLGPSVVSLGLLSTPLQVGIIVVSVVILVEFHRGVLWVFKRVVDESHPSYSNVRDSNHGQ